MERRQFTKTMAGGSMAMIAGISGCSSVTGGLEVIAVEARSTDFGNVIMGVRVENTANEPRSGTLVGQVDLDAGDTYTESRSIRVPGDDSNDYRLEFDISLGDSLSGSSYTYEAWVET